MLYQMASMGRCGETLLLRCLNAHSRITSVGHGFQSIDRDNFPALAASDQIYVVKQADWEEPEPFAGFVLVRQPLAVYRSLLDYKGKGHGVSKRLKRWWAGIDPTAPELLGTDVEMFCRFYNRRFGALRRTALPVIRYERLVDTPEAELRRVCAFIGVDFEPQMLNSHHAYPEGSDLHAGTRGDLPIHTNSLGRWRDLSPDDQRQIVEGTRETWQSYGYDLDSMIDAAPAPLISPEYQSLLQQAHAQDHEWGSSAKRRLGEVLALAHELGAGRVLDYGCGKGVLLDELCMAGLTVAGYDPGMPEYSAPPATADLLVCIDVLEHIEPASIDAVLAHIATLAPVAYLVIALFPARKILPDGRNAHLIVQPPDWWLAKLATHFGKVAERSRTASWLVVTATLGNATPTETP